MKESSRLVIEMARRMVPVNSLSSALSGTVNIVAQTARNENLSVLARAAVAANVALRGQNPGAAPIFSKQWAESREVVASLGPLFATGLFNTIVDAEDAKDFTTTADRLDQLRDLRRFCPDGPAIRLQLAMILTNSINFTRNNGLLDLNRGLIAELDGLRREYPQDGAVARELSTSYRNEVEAATGAGSFDKIDALIDSMRELQRDSPDDVVLQYLVDALSFGVVRGLRAGRTFEQGKKWLNELAFWGQTSPASGVALVYAQTLATVGFFALKENVLPRFLAVVVEIRKLQPRFSTDPQIALLATNMICDAIGNTPWTEVLPTQRPALAHLQKLRADFPHLEAVQKPIGDLLNFLERSCSQASDELKPLKDGFLAELKMMA